eukprot:scaffold104622_cov70-Phaeocystis_antarctica.AAC.2
MASMAMVSVAIANIRPHAQAARFSIYPSIYLSISAPFSSASEERVDVESMILLSLAIAAPVKSGGASPSASASLRSAKR